MANLRGGGRLARKVADGFRRIGQPNPLYPFKAHNLAVVDGDLNTPIADSFNGFDNLLDELSVACILQCHGYFSNPLSSESVPKKWSR